MFCNLCLSCVVSFGVIILKLILKQYAPKQLSEWLFVSVTACCVTRLSWPWVSLFSWPLRPCHPLDTATRTAWTVSPCHWRFLTWTLWVLVDVSISVLQHVQNYRTRVVLNLFPLIPACTARPGLPLSPPETAFLESPYYRPQTASIVDRHHPTNFHSVTYTQTDDAAFEAGSDNDHKSFLRMRVIFKVEYPAELFRFRRVLDDILSSFDVF